MLFNHDCLTNYPVAGAILGCLLLAAPASQAQEHLETIETSPALSYPPYLPGPAQQGVDWYRGRFYSSSGWAAQLNNILTRYIVSADGASWAFVGNEGPFLFLPPHFGDLTASDDSLFVPMSFFGWPGGPEPFSIGVFSRSTLGHETSYGLDALDALYEFEDVAGADYFDGDLLLVDYRSDTPDNTRILRIDLASLQLIEVYEVATRMANGIESYGSYLYLTSADAPANFGAIDVYDYAQLLPSGLNAPLATYTFDVSGVDGKILEHAEGLTFRDGNDGAELWVCVANGRMVRHIETPILPPDGPQQCNYLSIESTTCSDDGDGTCEAGETVGLTICLDSTADVQNVQACLSALDPDVNIFDACNDYGLIFADQTDCGDDDFDMDLLFDSSTYVVFTLHVEYEKDGAQCYQDLNFIEYFPEPGEVEPAFEVCQVVFEENPDIDNTCWVDGIVQSGEQATIRLQLRNVGSALPTGVRVSLTPVPEFVYFQGGDRGYPDMVPGGPCVWATNDGGWTIRVQRDLSGTFYSDVIIEYENSSASPQVIPNGVCIQVVPAPWIEVSPPEHDFGVVQPGQLVIVPVTVANDGNAPMDVSGIVLSHPDHMSFNSSELPGTLLPGEFATGEVVIDTTNLSGFIDDHGAIFESNACRGEPVPEDRDDRIFIAGLVSPGVPTWSVPKAIAVEYDDVGGNIIVWAENRYGDFDIFAYDLATQEEIEVCICPNDQISPRISGDLIAWQDFRNWDGKGYPNGDIYAFDMTTRQETEVSADPAHERLVGADNGDVAFTRTYYVFEETPVGQRARNLYVYDVVSEVTIPITDFVHNGHDPMGSVDTNQFDFGDNLLTWAEVNWTWKGEYWQQHSVGVMLRIGDASPQQIWSGIPYYPGPVTNCGKVALADDDGQGRAQIWIWTSGSWSQVTTEDVDHGTENLALGCDVVVYDKQGSHGLFGLCLDDDLEFFIPPDLFAFDASARMDGRLLGWSGLPFVLRYAFLKEADISVTSAGITLPDESPYAGEPFNVTVAVTNVAPWGTSDDITIELYVGHPQAGGILLASQVIVGGMPGQTQQVVAFTDVVIDTPATDPPHNICVRVVVPSGDNPANNIACKPLEVFAPGACCFQDGTCNEADTPDQCAAAGGIYQGDGSVCLPDGCKVTIGACCLPDGTCYDDFTANECAAAAGAYQGNETTCAEIDCSCTADLSGDGIVDAADLAILLGNWGPAPPGDPAADLDGDGVVDAADLAILLGNWGSC